MNTQQLDDALEKLSPYGNYPKSNQSEFLEATATLSLRFSSETSKINQDINIVFPKLTPKNSININEIEDLAEASDKVLEKHGLSRNLKTNSDKIKVDVKPIIIGKHVMLPLEQVCKNLNITYKTNKDNSYQITNNKINIKFTSNSNEITVNDTPATLNLPIMDIEKRLFVPLDFVENYLDASVIINEQDHTAKIIKK